MMLPLVHPSFDRLERFHTDALDDAVRGRTARHLERCARCRDMLAFLRDVDRDATRLPVPPLRASVLDRALADRARGVRVILPVDIPAPATGRPGNRVRAAIVAAVVVAAVVTIVSSREVAAGASESEMVLAPSAPHAGDRIMVTYKPSGAYFADASAVLLRARLRTPSSGAYDGYVRLQVLASLSRDRDGAFHGSFVVPDSVVFAALAVEDSTASIVDDRDGRAWRLLVHGADGRPTYDAMLQQENDYMGRSWEDAYATARETVTLYPNLIQSWGSLDFFETNVLGKAAADSAAATHTQVDSLVARYKRTAVISPNELGALFWQAFMASRRDTTNAKANDELAYWWGRLQREAPRQGRVQQYRALQLSNRYWESSRRTLLDSLEGLWSAVGYVDRSGTFMLNLALQAAASLGDGERYRRWASRAPVDGDMDRWLGESFVTLAPLRAEGMQHLRTALARDARALDMSRPLSKTRAEYQLDIATRRRALLGTLGQALIDAGGTRAGLDTLALAVADGWDYALFAQIATKRREAGDTAGALAIEARIAVDPRTRSMHVDSVTTVARRLVGDARWAAMLAEARTAMRTAMMARSVTRSVRGSPQVVDQAGRTIALRELTDGAPTFVVYWSRFCAPALNALPRINAVAARLRERGARTIMIVAEQPSPALAAFLTEHNVSIPVYGDTHREVASALKSFGTPAYYMLDASGRIRFTRAVPEAEALVQLEAIK